MPGTRRDPLGDVGGRVTRPERAPPTAPAPSGTPGGRSVCCGRADVGVDGEDPVEADDAQDADRVVGDRRQGDVRLGRDSVVAATMRAVMPLESQNRMRKRSRTRRCPGSRLSSVTACRRRRPGRGRGRRRSGHPVHRSGASALPTQSGVGPRRSRRSAGRRGNGPTAVRRFSVQGRGRPGHCPVRRRQAGHRAGGSASRARLRPSW